MFSHTKDLGPSFDSPSRPGDDVPPASPTEDPAFQSIVAALSALSPAERNAVCGLLSLWLGTRRPLRACLGKILWPELDDATVALLAGVSERQLVRYEEYLSVKPTLNDFRLSRPRADNSKRRRGFSNPDDPLA